MLDVTPVGRPVTLSVTVPVKLVRLSVRLTNPPALRLVDGCGMTKRPIVVVTDAPPDLLAVAVIVWLAAGAFASACRLTDPDDPVPGCVMLDVTPVGKALRLSVTLPV